MYFRTRFSISSLEMLVIRPASYCSVIHLWIREMPGCRLSTALSPVRPRWALIQKAIPDFPDLSVIIGMIGRFRILVVSKIL